MKLAGGWTAWVSGRFLTGRRGGRGRLIFLFFVVLIAGGVATLNTILAVMNGLQQGYIQSILEIGSYHIRWSDNSNTLQPENIAALRTVFAADPHVNLALEFREGQTMLNGERPRPSGALLRGVPESLYVNDETLAQRLDIIEGNFDVSGNGIVLGEELALNLGVSPGDGITALDLGGTGLSPTEVELWVTGVFQCGYREYEAALAFVSLEVSQKLFGVGGLQIGLKLTHPERDRIVLSALQAAAADYGGTLVSWRESNRAFFGALRTEKMMIFLLLALIFVVVAVNIDYALRRMAIERIEDIAVMKAVGASPRNIRILFLRHGLVIGGIGGLLGSVLGVLIGANVDNIIQFVRRLGGLVSRLLGNGMWGMGTIEAFFESSQVMLRDVFIILFLAILLSSLAALRAAGMAARLKPAEVLRSE